MLPDILMQIARAVGMLWLLVCVALPVTIHHEHGPYRSLALVLILVLLAVHFELWRERRAHIRG